MQNPFENASQKAIMSYRNVEGPEPRNASHRGPWRAALLLLAMMTVSGPQASAQDLLRIHDAFAAGGLPKWCFGLGDVNGDGANDYAVAALGLHPLGGFPGVAVFSGPTGTQIWFTRARPNHGSVIIANAVGDLDGDGVLDVALNSSYVMQSPTTLGDVCTFLSGRTGAYLGEILGSALSFPESRFESVHGLDDINGDGIPDVLLQWSVGEYRVYSGAPGHALLYLVPGASTLSPDQEVLGDLNGDGLRDYAIRYSALSHGPIMNVYSAATGQILYVLNGSRYVAGISDQNGDGVRDFATITDPTILIGSMYYGPIYLRSGVDGAILWRTFPPLPSTVGGQLGLDMQSGGDINGDGVDDIFSRDNAFFNNVLGRVLSGRTGAILFDINRKELSSARGCVPGQFETTRVIGDLDGDGYAEFAAAEPYYDECGTVATFHFGKIWIFRGGPGGETERLCDAAPNSAGTPARLRSLGAPEILSPTLGWQLHDAPAREFSQLVFGLALAPGAPPIAIGSGLLCFGAQGARRVGNPQQTDPFGVTNFLPLWTDPAIAASWSAGTTWVLQAVFRDTQDPNRANTSNALLTSFF